MTPFDLFRAFMIGLVFWLVIGVAAFYGGAL